LIATHPIECGEEVTASYIDWNTLLQPRADRRAAIEEIGGFECECSVCTLHENSDASDRNRIRLAELFQSWEDVGIELLAEQSDILVRLHEAAGLSLTERLIGPLAEIYAREFYVLAAWGKMERAKAVAEREMDALTRIRGREEAHNHFFAALWKDPASWGSFGFKLA
jgi:hypothetical protein